MSSLMHALGKAALAGTLLLLPVLGSGVALASPRTNDLMAAFLALSPPERAEFLKRTKLQPAAQGVSPAHAKQTSTAQGEPKKTTISNRIWEWKNPSPVANEASERSLSLYVRHDFADLGSLMSPIPTKQAAGAELSYSRDERAKNSVSSIQALVAATFNEARNVDRNGFEFSETTFGAYAAVNRVLNTSKISKSKNSETVSGGALAEFRFLGTPFGPNAIRVRGGGASDDISGVTQANLVAEWFPIYQFAPNIGFYYPFWLSEELGIRARFDPEVILQYDVTDSQRDRLLFNGRSEAFRAGPQFNLLLFTVPGYSESWLSRLSAKFVYHPNRDLYTGKDLSYLASSLTLNLDQDGIFGLTASYRKGAEETTGKREDLFKIALTAKL